MDLKTFGFLLLALAFIGQSINAFYAGDKIQALEKEVEGRKKQFEAEKEKALYWQKQYDLKDYVLPQRLREGLIYGYSIGYKEAAEYGCVSQKVFTKDSLQFVALVNKTITGK